jgi:hypothetical protein
VSTEHVVTIRVDDQATDAYRSAGQAADNYEQSADRATTTTDKAAQSKRALATAAIAAAAALAQSVRVYASTDAALGRLTAQLDASNISAADQQRVLQAVREDSARLAIEVTDVSAAYQEQIRVSRNVEQAQRAVALAADIAARENISLAQASSLLVQIQQGNTRALQGLGVATRDTVRELSALTDETDRISAAMEILREEYEGGAEATRGLQTEFDGLVSGSRDVVAAIGNITVALLEGAEASASAAAGVDNLVVTGRDLSELAGWLNDAADGFRAVRAESGLWAAGNTSLLDLADAGQTFRARAVGEATQQEQAREVGSLPSDTRLEDTRRQFAAILALDEEIAEIDRRAAQERAAEDERRRREAQRRAEQTAREREQAEQQRQLEEDWAVERQLRDAASERARQREIEDREAIAALRLQAAEIVADSPEALLEQQQLELTARRLELEQQLFAEQITRSEARLDLLRLEQAQTAQLARLEAQRTQATQQAGRAQMQVAGAIAQAGRAALSQADDSIAATVLEATVQTGFATAQALQQLGVGNVPGAASLFAAAAQYAIVGGGSAVRAARGSGGGSAEVASASAGPSSRQSAQDFAAVFAEALDRSQATRIEQTINFRSLTQPTATEARIVADALGREQQTRISGSATREVPS